MSFSKEKVFGFMDRYDYKCFIEQIETMDTIIFGRQINVLLISDRLAGCSAGLKEYLENSQDVTVDLVNNTDDANKVIQKKSIDFLIVVGYLINSKLYDVIQFCKANCSNPICVFYANIDSIIVDLQKRYGIEFAYPRRESADGFVSYMRELMLGKRFINAG